MPKITLTDLVDIVSSSGVPKATKISQIKRRPEYDPKFDFYKPLREAIQNLHQKGHSKEELDKLRATLTDKKKLSNYPAAIKGYKKWLGNKQATWFAPPRSEISASGVDVVVNPELGLQIGNERLIIKLYLKSEKLSKLRIDLITSAMEGALRSKSRKSDTMCVLDVRRAKLFKGNGKSKRHSAIVAAELAYVATLWNQI